MAKTQNSNAITYNGKRTVGTLLKTWKQIGKQSVVLGGYYKQDAIDYANDKSMDLLNNMVDRSNDHAVEHGEEPTHQHYSFVSQPKAKKPQATVVAGPVAQAAAPAMAAPVAVAPVSLEDRMAALETKQEEMAIQAEANGRNIAQILALLQAKEERKASRRSNKTGKVQPIANQQVA